MLSGGKAFLSRARSRSRFALMAGLMGALLCAALFISFPEIDLAVSRIFYRPKIGGDLEPGFWLAQSESLKFFFWLIDAISRAVLLASIAVTVVLAFKKSPKRLASAIVTLSLLAGPTLLVNSGLKEHWHRARPGQIVEFGGQKQFTPAWIISDQCARNCSFTSGHAAAGFSFLIGYFVAQSPLWLWLGVLAGTLTGLTRIMVGAHFLSDVVFSFFVVYLTTALVTLVLTARARAV